MFTYDAALWWLLVGKGDDSRYGEITITCLQAKKINFKKYFLVKCVQKSGLRENSYSRN